MKMTKQQAKIILIVGWSIFAIVYLASMILCFMLKKWLSVSILILCFFMIVAEYRRYIARLQQKK